MITWHSVFSPQTPTQGSIHLFRSQALFLAQSESTTHSYRHSTYGLPNRPVGHVHSKYSPKGLHKAFWPQGSEAHGRAGVEMVGTVGVEIVVGVSGTGDFEVTASIRGHVH